RVVRVVLIRLARYPIPAVRGEQREPVLEFALVEEPRLVQQEPLAAIKVERLAGPRRGPATRHQQRAPTEGGRRRLGLAAFCHGALERVRRRRAPAPHAPWS